MKVKINRSLLGILVLACVIVLPAISPFFNQKLFNMHDWTHVARLTEMHSAITDGHIPVRWSKNLGFGFGTPLFNFYAPLPYYLGSMLMMLGISEIISLKLLFITTFFGSFGAMYLLGREYWGEKTGLVAATAFTYLPYRAVNVYVRGALGELFGMMLFVLCWWSITKITKSADNKHIYLASLIMAGFLLSHNLVVLMGYPMLVLYALIRSRYVNKIGRVRVIFGYLKVFLLSAGAAAFFIIPMLTEQSNTSVSELITLGGDYRKHFVFVRQLWNSAWGYGGSIEGLFDGFSFELGKAQTILMLIGSWMWIRNVNKTKDKWLVGILLGGLIFSVFMTNIRSIWLWGLIPQLSYTQFPWRFIFFAGFFMSILDGTMIKEIPSSVRGLLLISAVVGTIILMNIGMFQATYDLSNDKYISDPDYLQTEVSKTLPEYIHPRLNKIVMEDKTMIPTPPKSRFEYTGSDKGDIKIIDNRTHRFEILLNAKKGGILRVNIFEYPGWTYYLNGKEVEPLIADDLPVYLINLPASGSEYVEIIGSLRETFWRKVANTISLVSGSIIILGLMPRLSLNKLSKRV